MNCRHPRSVEKAARSIVDATFWLHLAAQSAGSEGAALRDTALELEAIGARILGMLDGPDPGEAPTASMRAGKALAEWWEHVALCDQCAAFPHLAPDPRCVAGGKIFDRFMHSAGQAYAAQSNPPG